MAVLTSTAWLRSQVVTDIWTFTLLERKHQVYLDKKNQQIYWIAAGRDPSIDVPDGWVRLDVPSRRAPLEERLYYDLDLMRARIDRRAPFQELIDLREWRLPFQWIVLTTTVVSACLILWKPRAKSADAFSLPQSPIPNPKSPDHA